MITTASSQIGPLTNSNRHLESGIDDGRFAVDHCRSMMIIFAAERTIG